MDDQRGIERRFRRTPVRILDHDGLHGVLRLRGRRSRLEVSGEGFFHFEPEDENGWFDLAIRALDGREILLHHAITLQSGHHQWGGDRDPHYARIFPNVVIDDLRGLSPARLVQRVSFRIDGLGSFFHYRHAEPLRAYQLDEGQLAALRSMRYVAEGETAEDAADGEFDPREIYVVHAMPVFMDFMVEGRRYRVWAGGRFSGGNWDLVDARVHTVAEISFDAPVDIETALDRVWEWRRLFVQVAMCQLSIDAISVTGSLDDRAPSANVYLPNARRRRPLRREAPSPAKIPLNTWAERDRLAEALRTWLSQDADRRNFRIRVDRVLTRINRRIDPSDLIDLSAAVDGLAALSVPTGVTEKEIARMVDAAHAAAGASGSGVGRDRIAGLLGNLARPSLAARLSGVAAALSPPPTAEEVALLVRSATRVRNAMAHGRAIDEQVQPRVAPTVEALAAMCARYDLETCGFPSRTAHEMRSVTKRRFDEGLQALARLDSPASG